MFRLSGRWREAPRQFCRRTYIGGGRGAALAKASDAAIRTDYERGASPDAAGLQADPIETFRSDLPANSAQLFFFRVRLLLVDTLVPIQRAQQRVQNRGQ
jgi:hypothetical protein